MTGMRLLLSMVFLLMGLGAASADAPEPFSARLEAAALARTKHQVVYDGAYVAIAYPLGDVAPDRGVCSDVVIRAYRALGVDLQRLVHEDMADHFDAYPAHWGLTRPDRNIDHRRVPNLATFLTRQGARLPVSRDRSAYRPGDLVTFNVHSHDILIFDRSTGAAI